MKKVGTRNEVSSIRITNSVIRLRDKEMFLNYEYFKDNNGALYINIFEIYDITEYQDVRYEAKQFEIDYFEEKIVDKLI
jgi:hypothetical protein